MFVLFFLLLQCILFFLIYLISIVWFFFYKVINSGWLQVIKCLELGVLSRCAGPLCVSALTLCVLEMRDSMIKLLREVMINLSKITATVQNAQPILEFLSSECRCDVQFWATVYGIGRILVTYRPWHCLFLLIHYPYFTSPSFASPAKSVCQFCVWSVYVNLCDCYTVHKSIQVQPLYCVTCIPRHCHVVPQVQTSLQKAFCAIYI